MRRVIVFGTGKKFEQYKNILINVEIVAFIDNDTNKQGSYINQLPVINPKDVLRYQFDYVIIMSVYIDVMKKQLIDLGVEQQKCVSYLDCEDIVEYVSDPCIYNFKHDENKKIVVLLTNELSNTGAPTALLYMAQIFEKKGFSTYVISMRDGDIRKIAVNEDITVIIEPLLSYQNLIVKKIVENADLIIFNTVEVGFAIPRYYKINSKIGWWLHESEYVYKYLYCSPNLSEVISNINIFAVSQIARSAFLKCFLNANIDILEFGIPELIVRNNSSNSSDKIIFAIIGYIHPIKGQDILIKAIDLLENQYSQKLEVWAVGAYSCLSSDIFCEHFEKAITSGIIKYKGELQKSDLNHLYSNIDVIVCSSREETMSAVVIEGMMHSKACIVSNSAGISSYINNYVDGFVFESENVQELCNIIKKCIVNKEKLKQVGNEARKVYEKNFTMKCFEKNIQKMIDKIIEI